MQKYTFLRDSRHNHRVIAARKVRPYGTFQTGCRSLHSFAFYFGTAVGDWTDPQNADLWRDETKTLFDPCPSGWRVPLDYDDDRSPWLAFTLDNGSEQGDKTTKGRLFIGVGNGGNPWYPYSGRRNREKGLFDIVQSYFQGWSSSSSGTTSTSPAFNTNYIYHAYTLHVRAYGLSVRCVRE